MLRLAFLLVMALSFTNPLLADEKPKPNTLTPKEIADGWILLFDGETTFGWKVEGDVAVKEGVLVLGGQKASTATITTLFGSYDLRIETTSGKGSITLQSVPGGSCIFGSANLPSRIQMTHRIRGDGTAVSQSRNVGVDMVSQLIIEATTTDPASLQIEVPAGGKVSIKSAKLRPVGAKPLFNGKNLDGWKVTQTDPKRVSTKFEVTKEGELSAKNGPGDLQTEKQFDDFVLQLECKTNGLALNSGIFFRCMPDAYQNGYEAQIQNAYLGDRTKPIDYGTGAIYRRIAARKVVSNDNEWFTMTVAARGAHIATWVNGYQTVDWTDDRKANDNPRQGLRTAKGHLSIQGHDPTTDLLFRNIRIAELPKP